MKAPKKYVDRAREIVNQMTLDEKIGMIHGAELFKNKGVERLGIPQIAMSDGPMGVRAEFEPSQWKLREHYADQVSYLPCNSAIASTWNRKLSHEAGRVLGEEARGRGKDVILAPGINIKRSPLCGRNFEYFSEDPYLTGELAAEYIQGVQENDVAACVKHFAINNQESKRLEVEAVVDEDVLRSIYLKAFKIAVQKGNAYSIMSAYNKYKGSFCSESKELLKDILRDEWGYDGTVISDWGAVHNTVEAANSELDLEMSVFDNFDDYVMANPLKKAISDGKVSEKVVDKKCVNLLVMMQRLNMLDEKPRKSGAYNTFEHRQSALDVARESVILLKNDKNVLPLHDVILKNVLVIGENADRIHSNGGGSAEIKAMYETTTLMGLKSHLGGNTNIDFVEGYSSGVSTDLGADTINWQQDSLENGGGSQGEKTKADEQLREYRKKLREEAITAAKDKKYDAVIFVGGLNHTLDSEGLDRPDIELPYEQDELIQELLDVRQDAVIVMYAGSPVDMSKWVTKANTLLWSYYAGMEGGNAIADVILGNVNPSGKLAETFNARLEDSGAHALGEFPGGDFVVYKERKMVGYRYNDAYNVRPLFPFGHGLSYTNFEYRDVEVKAADNKIVVNVSVENAGNIDGAETVQVYVRQKSSELYQELAGFDKIHLKAGETGHATIELDEDMAEKILNKTIDETFEIAIGASSRDIRIAKMI